jgi:histidinol-phosphate aminotransferase
MEVLMKRYWSEVVRGITPYIPGEQPKEKKYIKLNTNENPYPPSPRVIEVLKNTDLNDLRLYPEPACDKLRKTLADYYGIGKDMVFVGNGSDEVLAFAFKAFFNRGETIMFPDITYTFYPVYSKLFEINYKIAALDKNFSIHPEMFYKKNDGIIIANPNAPTGKFMPVSYIEDILEHNGDCVVIIDEAYVDFGGESCVKLTEDYPNLLVTGTFSKSRSLAGLRIGYALGHSGLIEGLDRVKNSINSYTLDMLAMIAGVEAVKDEQYFKKIKTRIINTREWVTAKLSKELGFKVIDSKANFLFVSYERIHAKEIFDFLRTKGILVRYFDKDRINNFLRISMGTDEDMEYLTDVLKEYIRC